MCCGDSFWRDLIRGVLFVGFVFVLSCFCGGCEHGLSMIMLVVIIVAIVITYLEVTGKIVLFWW